MTHAMKFICHHMNIALHALMHISDQYKSSPYCKAMSCSYPNLPWASTSLPLTTKYLPCMQGEVMATIFKLHQGCRKPIHQLQAILYISVPIKQLLHISLGQVAKAKECNTIQSSYHQLPQLHSSSAPSILCFVQVYSLPSTPSITQLLRTQQIEQTLFNWLLMSCNVFTPQEILSDSAKT